MAKFQPILGNIAGSIGGNTWANNRGGMYVRRRSVPTNPTTTAQLLVRSYLSQLTKAWQTLPEQTRTNWNTWAETHGGTNSLGNNVNYTGHQMFIALNLRRLQMGLLTNLEPPTDDTPPSLTSFTVDATNIVSVDVDFTPTPLGAGLRLQLWQCLPHAGARNPVFSQARLVGYSAVNPTAAVTFTLPRPVNAGESCVFYACVVSESGLQSPPLRYKVG